MNEQHEYQLRRQAIRLTLQGHSRQAILARIGRSPAWLSKWLRRFDKLGWQGLRSRSRARLHPSTRYSDHTRHLVVATRQRLLKRHVTLSGPQAIQDELRHAHLMGRVPSLATIKRILHDAHLIHHPHPPKRGYFPQPTPCSTYVLHAMDWTARYLTGGAKLFVFHTVDVQTRALTQTLHTDKSGATVRAHALATWQHLGLPDGLQLDNDAAFNGGYKVPRVFGAFVRLCLYLGIEPIFVPVGEPKRNSVVERLHGLWSQTFWCTHRFDTLAEVRRAAPQFVRFYTERYHPAALQGATPSQAHQQVTRRQLTAAERAAAHGRSGAFSAFGHNTRADHTAERDLDSRQVFGGPVCLGNHQHRTPSAADLSSAVGPSARTLGERVSLCAARAGSAAGSTVPATLSTAQDVHDVVSLFPSIELHSGFTMW
jgi:hypothetical protein